MSSIHALNVPLFSFVHCSTSGATSLTTRLQNASAAAPSVFSLHAPVSWSQLDVPAVISVPIPSFATPALRLFRPEPAVLEPRVRPLTTALLETVFTNPPLIAAPVTLYADPAAGRVQDKPFPGSRRVLAEVWEGRLDFRIYGEPLDLTVLGIWNETVARVQDGWDWIHNELQNECLDLQKALGRAPGSLKDTFVLSALRRLASGRLRPEGGIDELLAGARPLLQSCHAREVMELLFRLRRKLEEEKIPIATETKILKDLLKTYDKRLEPLLPELHKHLKNRDDEIGALRAATALIRLGETPGKANDAEEILWTRSDRWFDSCNREQLLQTILAFDPHDALERLIPLLEKAWRQGINPPLIALCFEAIGLLGIPEALPALNGLSEITGQTFFKGEIGQSAAVAYARLGDLDNAQSQASLYQNGWASPLLSSALKNDDLEVRIAAAEALGDRQTLLGFLKSSEAWLVIRAAEALMRLGDFDEARERLMEILNNNPDFESPVVLSTIGRYFPPEFASDLHPFLERSYWSERYPVGSPIPFLSNVVATLGEIGNPESFPQILPLLLDSENRILVESAAKSVAALGQPEEARRALMRLFTADPNPYELSLLLDMVWMGGP